MNPNRIGQFLARIIMDISRQCRFKIRGILLDYSFSPLNGLRPSRSLDNNGIAFFRFNQTFRLFLESQLTPGPAGGSRFFQLTPASTRSCLHYPVDPGGKVWMAGETL
jgi:hypothetical protein